MRLSLRISLLALSACEYTPATGPAPADAAAQDEGLSVEGQPWLYTGEIPGEADAGVCSEEDCDRCVLLQDGHITITYRTRGTDEPWTSVDYGLYTPAMGSESTYIVDLRWTWTATSADGLPTGNSGYIVIAEKDSAASDYTTLGIGVCPE